MLLGPSTQTHPTDHYFLGEGGRGGSCVVVPVVFLGEVGCQHLEPKPGDHLGRSEQPEANMGPRLLSMEPTRPHATSSIGRRKAD